MTNNTIPHDHHHHHQEMDQLQLQALAVKPPQAKRQARRRTHTSRPYQERLLNMAEARREIVTALKIHRATTSSTRQQLQQQQQEEQIKQQVQQVVAFQDRSQSQAPVDEEASLAHTTVSYAAAASFADNPLCSSQAAHWIAAAGSYCSPPPPILRLPCALTPPEVLPLPTAAAAMGGLVELKQEEHYQGGLERLVRSLPAQPLGLNLSFQGFGVSVVDDGAKDDCEDFFGSLPLTRPSPYSSPPAVETTTATIPHACGGHGSPSSPVHSATDAENEKHSVIDDAPAAAAAAAALVPVLLDGGTEMMMAQQASTGGAMQGVVEWSEAAAAADVAAWWSKIFESGQRGPPNAEDDDVAAGLPAEWRWLCGDDVGAAEQGSVTGAVLATMMHVDDGCCYEGGGRRSDDGEDVTLPCMDGIVDDDVQGWDGEWFSGS